MEAVQVLSVEENGRYVACDAAAKALGRVAGDMPVAVLSVAGATRGGKSFLLDFCLRYLRATEESRRDGTWLGADDEPLTGFGWRGGCDRHTEGILMWPEPIVIDVGTGGDKQKVAVILLDTQGSFDSSSTVRDSSTVFAISTLLTSVQVYNLSQNIKEDDLQYLQLFTEYGKLAREERSDTKPFQELKFLVRDWMWAYQHPYGAAGGQELLHKRLQIREEQAPELREVRAHIRDVFEGVNAFLLAHPGLSAATNPAFTGCLKDLTPEFKHGLLELVPSLLSPSRLLLKRINGQTVSVHDFVHYLCTYVDIFNSDTLPTPTTVMQASAAASVEAAVHACRAVYAAQMSRGARSAACVSRAALLRHHAHAVDTARAAFLARRTFAAPVVVAARLEAFIQELEASLSDRVAVNNAHILEAAAACKLTYEIQMDTDKCLTSIDLLERHETAVDGAKTAFESAFAAQTEAEENEQNENTEADREDIEKDWETVKQDLQGMLPLHRERNQTRIEAAMSQAREAYAQRMGDGLSVHPCFHTRSLRSLHRESAAAARDILRYRWMDEITPQEWDQQLRASTEEQYREFVATNDANNEREVEMAISLYCDIITEIFEDGRCLHPADLATQHARAQDSALARFLEQRDPAAREAPADVHHRNLIRGLIPEYKRFEKMNNEFNEAAVKAGHDYYLSHIAPFRFGGESVLDLFGPPDLDVFSRHAEVKRDAIGHFLMRRRPANADERDVFLVDLDKKIENSYSWIVAKTLVNLAAQGLSLISMTSVLGNVMRR